MALFVQIGARQPQRFEDVETAYEAFEEAELRSRLNRDWVGGQPVILSTHRGTVLAEHQPSI